jgi:hypothetical protein
MKSQNKIDKNKEMMSASVKLFKFVIRVIRLEASYMKKLRNIIFNKSNIE